MTEPQINNTIGYAQRAEDVENFKECVLSVSEALESKELDGTILPGATMEEKLRAFEQFLDKSPRKFRRKFVRQKFSDRFMSGAAKRIEKNESTEA